MVSESLETKFGREVSRYYYSVSCGEENKASGWTADGSLQKVVVSTLSLPYFAQSRFTRNATTTQIFTYSAVVPHPSEEKTRERARKARDLFVARKNREKNNCSISWVQTKRINEAQPCDPPNTSLPKFSILTVLTDRKTTKREKKKK